MHSTRIQRRIAGGLVAFALVAPAAAQSATGVAEDAFIHAYFLENERGDLAGAIDLYEAAATNPTASEELRARAVAAASMCREDLASSDFASLVPEDTIAYFEFNNPGDQLESLLSQLGLVQDDAHRLGVSPLLVQGLFGMRGAAVAITDVDPTGGPPNGVFILHPGELDVVRGLIETALPAAGERVDSIGGHATYNIEGQVFVTTTECLVIASPDPGQIAGVLKRIDSGGRNSLAKNVDLADTMAMRGDDLMFFLVNAEPIMPMLMGLLHSQMGDSPEVAMAMQFLDPESLRAISGRLGVDDTGLSMDLGLQLDEGHRNLAFNLLRMPHIGDRTFDLVPEGAAFFYAAALNDESHGSEGAKNANGEPVVTLMDFGREIFGNIADIAIYGLPSVSPSPWGEPIPDIALAIRSNDPERSRALWNLVLGIGSQAASQGHGSMEPKVAKIAGERVERYDIAGMPVFLLTTDDSMVFSASENAIAAAIQGKKRGRSVRTDKAFAASLKSLRGSNTTAVVVNAGRCAEIAKHYMSDRERREIMPYLSMLSDTTASFSVQHSDTTLAISARVDNLPDVSPFVEQGLQMMKSEMRNDLFGHAGAVRAEVARVEAEQALLEARYAEALHQAKSAHTVADAPIAADAWEEKPAAASGDRDQLRAKFEKLVDSGAAEQAILEIGERVYELSKDDAFYLNNFAWALLTEDRYGNEYDKYALEMSKVSNELSGHSNWFYLDTLAHAYFQAGEYGKAVKIQTKAVEIAGDDARAGEAKDALERFQKAAKVEVQGAK